MKNELKAGESSEQRDIYAAAMLLRVVFSRSCAQASIYRVLFSESISIAIASSPWLLAKSSILKNPTVVDGARSVSLQIYGFRILLLAQSCFIWYWGL